MIKVMLMVKNPGETNWKGQGSREFTVMPRVGERIELDIEGTGYLYQVVSVHHPHVPTMTAGDIYAVQLGETVKLLGELFNES